MHFTKLLIPALISAALSGCGGGGSDGGPSGGFAMQGLCGNGLANGNDIISGPSSSAGNTEDYDQPFRSLTVDPTDPDIVYVGTEDNGILKTTDGGVSWTRLRRGLRHYADAYPEIYDISVSATNHNVLYAVANQGPGPLVSDTFEVVGGVYRSDDAGESWYRSNCGLDGIHVASIQVSPEDEDKVVSGFGAGSPSISGETGFYEGSLYWSADGGDNWTRTGLPTIANQVAFFNLYALSGGRFITFGVDVHGTNPNLGFYQSADYGQSWSPLPNTLAGKIITFFAVSSDGNTIYAVARDAFTIDRTTDGGMTWTTFSLGANAIAVSPVDSSLVIFGDGDDLIRSTDGLATTTTVLTNSSNRRFQDIAFAPSDPAIIYAVTDGWMEAEGYYFYRSSDGGLSFTLMKKLRSEVINVQP